MLEEAARGYWDPNLVPEFFSMLKKKEQAALAWQSEFPLSNERLQAAQPQYSIVVPVNNER